MYENLIVAMKLRRVTIEDIAEFLGIHRNSVSNKINGNSKFTISSFIVELRQRGYSIRRRKTMYWTESGSWRLC